MRSTTVHNILGREHPKTGSCVECGQRKRTVWAFQCHPQAHTLDIADYREQCFACHGKLDALVKRLQIRFGAEALAA